MNREVYQYTFSEDVSTSAAEDLLLLAVVAVECLRGNSAVRLEAACALDRDRRTCVIDVSSGVGHSIARIFTGFLTREYGDGAFRVQKRRNGGNELPVQDAT